MDAPTKSSLLLFVAAGLLATTHPACAANREVDAFLQRASETATARLASEGVQVPTGLRVKARVDSDGRLNGLRVVASSGSLETDQKAAAALRRLRVPQPPLALIGADVNVAVGPPSVLTAKAP